MELQIARVTADVILVLVDHHPHFMIPTIEVMVTVSEDREALLVHHHTLVLGDRPDLRPDHHVVAVEEVVVVAVV